MTWFLIVRNTARKNIKTVQTFVWMILTLSMSVTLNYQAVWTNVLVKPDVPLDAKVRLSFLKRRVKTSLTVCRYLFRSKITYISMHYSEKQPPVLKTRKLVAIAQNCHSYVILSIAAQKVTFPNFVTSWRKSHFLHKMSLEKNVTLVKKCHFEKKLEWQFHFEVTFSISFFPRNEKDIDIFFQQKCHSF